MKPMLLISICLAVCVSASSLPTFAAGTAASSAPQGFLTLIEMASEQTRRFGSPNRACTPIEAPSRAASRKSFVETICAAGKNGNVEGALEAFRTRGGKDAIAAFTNGSVRPADFEQDLRFFFENNAKISADFGKPSTGSWTPPAPLAIADCAFVSGAPPKSQQINFGRLSFVTTEQFSFSTPAEIDTLSGQLKARIERERPDALIVQNHRYGQPLECQDVLTAALSTDGEFSDENGLIVKQGFLKRIALIPGDNRPLSTSDIARFYAGNSDLAQSASRDVTVVNVLTSYYFLLQKKVDHPLEQALQEVARANGEALPFDANQFRAVYQSMNHRRLPTNPKDVYDDFTRASLGHGTRETNLAAEREESLRNEALLRAIQVSADRFSHPMVVSAGGDLARIGPTLRQQLPPMQAVDFRDHCH